MLDGVMIGSDCADFWDQALKEYKEELDAYVMENPGYWGVTVATVKATGADFAHIFFVDLIRLGEGTADGSVKGVVQDILRVLSVIPQGRILKAAKPAPSVFGRIVQTIRNTTFWRRIDGSLCAPIAIGQAMERTGQKLAVSLKRIADAIGIPLETLRVDGISISKIGEALEKLGLQFDMLPKGVLKDLGDVFAKAAAFDGPVMVGIKGVRDGVEVLHAVLVSKTSSGIRIVDRAGKFASFEELARRYGLKGSWSLNLDRPVYLFKNAMIDDALIHLIERSGPLACLVRFSMGVFDFNRDQVTPEFVKEDFKKFVEAKRGEEIKVVGGKTVTTVAGDPWRSTLSGVAKMEYGTFDLWPLIYDVNKEKVGPNPNRVKAGTPLLVLPLKTYTQEEIADAKRRAPTWKNYK